MSIALVSVPGYGHGLLPGALPTLSEALGSQGVQTKCYFLCAEFSDLLLRRHPELINLDSEVAQWARSYHEVFFHDVVKHHSEGRTAFPLPDGFDPSISARRGLTRSPRARTYCNLMMGALKRRAKEIAKAGHPVIGFSCSQNSQFYTALFVALEILRHSRTKPLLIFGGGLFDVGNVARFAGAFGMVDVFVARDGVDILAEAVRRKSAAVSLQRNVIGPPPKPARGWPGVMRKAPGLPPILLRHKGHFQVVVSSSRGCSWGSCKFCCHAVRERHVFYDPAKLAKELRQLYNRYGIEDVLFGDLEINPSPERVRELSIFLSRLPQSMKLWGLINSRCNGTEIFRLFRNARFTNLQCGIEALNQAILDRMNKGTTVLNNVMAMRLAHEFKLEWFFAPLIEGFTGETKEDVQDTLKTVQTVRHLLCKPVDAEIVGCYRHRGAWLGSKLNDDDLSLGSSRWFDPDQIPTESINSDIWSKVKTEIQKARRERPFLLAKLYSGLTRMVDGRGAEVRVHDFRGSSKQIVDSMLEEAQPLQALHQIAGSESDRIMAGLIKRRLVLSHSDLHLCVAVRSGNIGTWEYRA